MPQMQISSLFIPLDESQKGFQLLQKQGWKKGTGLGKFQQGRLEPINPLSAHDIERILHKFCYKTTCRYPTRDYPICEEYRHSRTNRFRKRNHLYQ